MIRLKTTKDHLKDNNFFLYHFYTKLTRFENFSAFLFEEHNQFKNSIFLNGITIKQKKNKKKLKIFERKNLKYLKYFFLLLHENVNFGTESKLLYKRMECIFVDSENKMNKEI